MLQEGACRGEGNALGKRRAVTAEQFEDEHELKDTGKQSRDTAQTGVNKPCNTWGSFSLWTLC